MIYRVWICKKCGFLTLEEKEVKMHKEHHRSHRFEEYIGDYKEVLKVD